MDMNTIKEKRLDKSATSIANMCIFPKVTFKEYGENMLLMNALDVKNMVKEYIRNHKHPFKIDVKEGILYINGDILGRIVPSPSATDSEAAGYYEGLILAQQGL